VRAVEGGFEVELEGAIANMVGLSAGAKGMAREPDRSSVKVVAGACNHLYRTWIAVCTRRREPRSDARYMKAP
jgi:hypothetical protein